MEIEKQARIEAILENAVDAIITIDERGIVEIVNPATEKVFGYKSDEMIGQNVKMLMPNPYRDNHDQYLRNYQESGERKIIGIGREVIGRRKDGTEFPMHLAVSEFHTGERRLFTGIVRDISDLHAAQKELEKLNAELENRVQERTQELRETQAELLKKEKLATLGQVSGGIAHEIRNPLNAVKTSAYYLLNARNPSAEKTSEHLNRIDRQVTLIDNVVTALSDVARMPEPKLQSQDIGPLLQSVLNSVSLPNNIEVRLFLPTEPTFAKIDENQVPIVFRNLVRNARDAMPDGGTLKIEVSKRDSGVTITVHDTGIGISTEEIKRVTEPLYSTKARGMGLGLAISQAIIEKNHGKLHITSQPNVGSTFSVTFQAGEKA